MSTSRENLSFRETPSRSLLNQLSWSMSLDQGKIPPSLTVRLGLSTSAGSTFNSKPIPVHFAQAPWGLLKENVRGSISGKEMLSTGQAKFSENKWSLKLLGNSGNSKLLSRTTDTTTLPLANRDADSID